MIGKIIGVRVKESLGKAQYNQDITTELQEMLFKNTTMGW